MYIFIYVCTYVRMNVRRHGNMTHRLASLSRKRILINYLYRELTIKAAFNYFRACCL